MKLTALAIRKSMTSIALMVLVVILGVYSYRTLPRESSPDVKVPYVMVYAPWYGTSPGDMENLVTREIETQLKAIADVEEMTSNSSEGVSSIILEFDPDVEMTDALQKVRDGVEMAKPELPDDVRDDVLVYELSSTDWPIMRVVVSGEFSLPELKEVGEEIQDDIEEIPGVLEVELTGGIEREVRVDVDPRRLRYHGLGLVDVLDAIALENVTLPGGELALGAYEYQVRVPGEFDDVAPMRGIVLNPGAEVPVYLGDVADVQFGVKDRDTISRLGGREAVTLTVKKRSGENILRIADEVKAQLARWGERLPAGSEIVVLLDESKSIRDMVRELENNILSGLLLVVAVLFLFLGLTNSLFVGAAIPFSMLLSFIVIQASGMTLNMVVLFSLILALGMLVDNAVVIVENIYRHRADLGMGADEAANAGTQQVATAVIASTITTLCAFGPMLAWPGITGEFMSYLPRTLIITLSASLLVALVFNPVLCARFMKVTEGARQRRDLGSRLLDAGLRRYEPTLRWALRHRAPTLGGMVGLLVLTLVAFRFFNAGVEFFPDIDPTYAYVQIEAPSGTRIELGDRYAREVEQEVAKIPELKAYVTEVGAGGDDFTGGSSQAPPHLTRISLEFLPWEDRQLSSSAALDDLRDRLVGFTGAQLVIDKQNPGPPGGKPVNIELSGDDFEVLGELARRVEEEIRDVPGLVDLTNNYDPGLPQIRIVPDREKAARLGLRTMDIASTVRTALQGDDISEYRVGEDDYDIVVRVSEPFRQRVEDLEDLHVFHEGENFPLTAFATIEFGSGVASITRIDGKRVVTVSADVTAATNANAALGEVQEQLAGLELPAGYQMSFTGESEDQAESQDFLGKAFLMALMLIAIVLITQFDSVTVPFVIMFSVILSLIGVFFGLMAHRMAFGIIMTGVGVISLAGIVVNNAIVLLDYIVQLRNEGMEKMEAIVEAGKIRFRPVLLTAITTILGLIPLTTGLSLDFSRLFSGDFGRVLQTGGESGAWWGPMGVAVIWGLAIATFLTLVVVPVMYSTIDPVLRGMKYVATLGWRRSAPPGQDEPGG